MLPNITFIQHDGEALTLEAKKGFSVMNVAISNQVRGIDADCGGLCNCATCHVYVDEQWMNKVGQPGKAEEAIMSLNPERQANSRLSCQIKISDQLDGLIITLPEFQY